MKNQALYSCVEEYPCESPTVSRSLRSVAGAVRGAGACGEAGGGTISSPISSLSQHTAQLGAGRQQPGLGVASPGTDPHL